LIKIRLRLAVWMFVLAASAYVGFLMVREVYLGNVVDARYSMTEAFDPNGRKRQIAPAL
jgi:uncharacterized membrane protein